MSRSLVLLLSIVLVLSGLVMVGSVFAQSVPEFTLKYVDYSYDVPSTTTTTTDPYTNETTTTTVPGYHVDNKTVEATIKNNLGASYYNFRYKGAYGDEWSYYPSDSDSVSGYNHYDSYSVPFPVSDSDYTVVSLYFLPAIPVDGEVDIQVQALFGDYRAVPYGHVFPLPAPTYDFYFEGTTSDWSAIQTIKLAESETPSPESTLISDPNFSLYSGLALLIIILVVSAVFLLLRKHKQ